MSAWHLLEVGPRQVLRDHLGSDDLDPFLFEHFAGGVSGRVETRAPPRLAGQRKLPVLHEDEVAERVEDRTAAVHLDTPQLVRTVAEDDIRPLVDGRVREFPHEGGGSAL